MNLSFLKKLLSSFYQETSKITKRKQIKNNLKRQSHQITNLIFFFLHNSGIQFPIFTAKLGSIEIKKRPSISSQCEVRVDDLKG